MGLVNEISQWFRRIFFPPTRRSETFAPFRHRYQLPSRHLRRTVAADIFLPPTYYDGEKRYPLLFFNDGQDLEGMQLEKILREGYAQGRFCELIAVGIHAGDRLQEYGTAGRTDYQQRGRRAAAYTRCVIRELIPFLQRNYRSTDPPYTLAGFSLGGLSAFDIAWKHPGWFHQVGVFSGSFWWRYQPFNPDDPDAHRIAHAMVRQSYGRKALRFWFQTGTRDETSDRNQNGTIDSIDDTRDLIAALTGLGYREGRDIRYVEVVDGEHHPGTWAEIMPDFLQWAFPLPGSEAEVQEE